MKDLEAALAEAVRNGARRGPQPAWIPPTLATLTERRFSDPAWIFERKLDGVRCLAFRRRGRVTMLSRNRLEVGNHYPEVVEALAARGGTDFVIDGEVVAFDQGQTSFARLQQRMQLRDPDQARRTGVAIFLYVFDVVHAAGYDLSRV